MRQRGLALPGGLPTAVGARDAGVSGEAVLEVVGFSAPGEAGGIVIKGGSGGSQT